ncbi:MAG: acyltransferase family protein [Cyclobacteriaceae bacterium]
MQRRHDIDWLRIIAIVLVLYFHVAMIFTEEWEWHIKNEELSYLWLEFNFWLSQFRMPLLFFVSGYGTYLALRKRSAWQYTKERHNRLMIPLVFSMFAIVPPQIYFERIFTTPGVYSSFLDFYPQTFNFIPYPTGDFSWHHMWFVLYLFFYSIIGLPLFLYLRKEKGQVLITQLAGAKAWRQIGMLTIPTIIIYTFWTGGTGRSNDFIHDWNWHPYWFSFFLAGFLIGIVPSIWDSVATKRRTLLGISLLSIFIINFLRWNKLEPWGISDNLEGLFKLLLGINAWAWLLAAAGYAKQYLNRPHPVLAYANQAIYPFYILHQTIIIAIGFYVVQVQEGMLAKYLFISSLSLIGSLVIYEYLIRPFRVMRFLFGVKSAKPPNPPNR